MNTVVGITDNWSDEGKYVDGCFADGVGRGVVIEKQGQGMCHVDGQESLQLW